jgi:hypothetical protein
MKTTVRDKRMNRGEKRTNTRKSKFCIKIQERTLPVQESRGPRSVPIVIR